MSVCENEYDLEYIYDSITNTVAMISGMIILVAVSVVFEGLWHYSYCVAVTC